MARWSELEAAEPELAEQGRQLFYQYGIGLGFLATVRGDSGPRLHPICPIIIEGGLYTFIVPSLKCTDLREDGRCALHCYPPPDIDDEFCVMGRASEVHDPELRARVATAYHIAVGEDDALFELDVERAMLTKYKARGEWPPTYTRWSA